MGLVMGFECTHHTQKTGLAVRQIFFFSKKLMHEVSVSSPASKRLGLVFFHPRMVGRYFLRGILHLFAFLRMFFRARMDWSPGQWPS